MKLKLELDIDWINDDGSIDDEVKDRVVNGIMNNISRDLKHSVKTHALKRIDSHVDNWITEQLNLFCDRRIAITDKWGDATEHHESVTEMLKAKLDGFLNETVDKNGVAAKGCTYGTRLTRIDYLLDTKTEAYFKKVLGDMDRKITNAINNAQAEAIQTEIKNRVINKLVEIEAKK